MNDVPAIVRMLANDTLGKTREKSSEDLPPSYFQSFKRIDSDPNQFLAVIEDPDDGIIATLQLTFIAYLTYQGGLRAQIESVRVREDKRGLRIGERLITWAIETARNQGAHLIQLTTDKRRPDAIRFYEGLGFEPSHEGMKLFLQNTNSR